MSRIAILFLACLAFAADNPWVKVQQLPDRSELRIYQKGAKSPLSATLADANEERIIVVAKNKQLAIAKDDIDRIDARTAANPSKPTVTKTEKTSDPDYTPQGTPSTGPALPTTSSSESVSFGSNKGDFKTVYVRPLGAPKK